MKIELLTGCLFLAAVLQAGAQAPHFITQPTNQTALASQTVTFWAEVDGDKPMYFQWYFGDSVLAGETTTKLVRTASPQWAGAYHLVAYNSYAPWPNGVSSYISVLILDPNVRVQPAAQTVLLGGAATFTTVATGTPPFAYQWFFNNSPLPGNTNDTLAFTNLTSADSGTYSVVLTNVFGSVTSSPTALAVVAELTRIKSFTNSSDGQKPFAPLIEGRDGLLYGNTVLGGASNQGTIFKLAKDGSAFTVLHSFSFSTNDGRQADGQLTEGADGALYGTTTYGGSADQGTVFKINKDGTGFSLLHSFGAVFVDGMVPDAGLIQGSDHLLYGTTYQGGSSYGTVFRLATNGTSYQVLRRFFPVSVGGTDDGYPGAPLLEGSDGMMYGTTGGGDLGGGSVFRLEKDGSGFEVIHMFNGPSDGRNPQTPLIEGSDGSLYGTTFFNAGSVFRLDKDGSHFAVLRDFSLESGGAMRPLGAVVEGPDGVLYGTAHQGSSSGAGAVFKLNKDGSDYLLLYSFTGSDGDGANPDGALLLGSDGAFYTPTSAGGDTGDGSIYKIRTLPLLRLAPRITGIRLTGTSVVLNGSRGTPGLTYQVLMSTNLSQALGSWTPIATNSFTATGDFSIILDRTGTPKASRQFYAIRVQ